VSDRALRDLERAAASGDLTAAADLARANRRAGYQPPAEIRIRTPFPARFSFPHRYERIRRVAAHDDTLPSAVPLDALPVRPTLGVEFRGSRLYLRAKNRNPHMGPREFALPFAPTVRSPEDALLHLRTLDAFPGTLGPGEERFPTAPFRITEVGAGLRVDFRLQRTWVFGVEEFVHYLISPSHGALLWGLDPFLFDLTQVSVDLEGPTNPEVSQEERWSLVVDAGPERLEAERFLRQIIGLSHPDVARARPCLGGPLFRGPRLILALAARALERRGVATELLWLDHGLDQLVSLQALPEELWIEAVAGDDPYPELGR
jgi:hypothetical protein